MRMQETLRSMERVAASLRQHNQWMERNRAQDGLRRMGQELEGAGERLRTMLREMERVCQDPELQRSRERLHEVDRLQERLRTLIDEMDRTGESLRHVAAGS